MWINTLLFKIKKKIELYTYIYVCIHSQRLLMNLHFTHKRVDHMIQLWTKVEIGIFPILKLDWCQQAWIILVQYMDSVPLVLYLLCHWIVTRPRRRIRTPTPAWLLSSQKNSLCSLLNLTYHISNRRVFLLFQLLGIRVLNL